MTLGPQFRARHRSVCDDEAVNAGARRHVDQGGQRSIVHVGRDLEQDRGAPARLGGRGVACVSDARKQIGQRLGSLQVAQAGRVRRRDVDGEVGSERREQAHAGDVVEDAIVAVAIGSDIDADDAWTPGAAVEAFRHRLMPLIVEAEPVDESPIGCEPKEARARVAVLRQRRDRSDLDEAEAEAEHRVGRLRILVETRGKTDGIGELESERTHREPRVARHGRRPRMQMTCSADGRAMRPLRIEEPQRTRDLIECAQAMSAGKACSPLGPSGSLSTRRTAKSGKRE